MLPAVTFQKLDTTNWMRAHTILHEYSKTVPSEALAKAVAFVVDDAMKNTYYTTSSKIDSELQVVSTPVLSTRGARAGLPRRDGKVDVSVPDTSLAAKVVLARLNRYSNYNVLTDMRYALDRRTFSAGMGKAGFWAKVSLVAQRMVKSRHSSTHFFQSSWKSVLMALAQLVPARYQGKFFRAGGDINKELGSAIMNGIGTQTPVLKIENRLGMDPKYPTINELRNMAAHQLLVPALQGAVNRNYEKQMQLIAVQELKDRGNKLQALGFSVR